MIARRFDVDWLFLSSSAEVFFCVKGYVGMLDLKKRNAVK